MERRWYDKPLFFCAALLLSVIVLFFRRPGQFLHPYLWDEDASQILPGYIADGLSSLADPVNSYLVLSSRLINIVSAKISFWYFPELSAALAGLFCIFVLFAIARSPTYLRYPWLCALLALLVKTDSECFLVALYSFWWAGLLLYLVLFWKGPEKQLLRIFFLFLGGFSGPMIIMVFPFLWLRALFERNGRELAVAALAVIPFAVQGYFIANEPGTVGSVFSTLADGAMLHRLVAKYWGELWPFLYGKPAAYRFAGGLALLGLIGISLACKLPRIWREKDTSTLALFMLAMLVGLSIVSTVARVPHLVPEISRFGNGPRYFFYPSIVSAWLLLWLLAETRYLIVKAVIFIVLFGFLIDGSLLRMRRDHYVLKWRKEIKYVCNQDAVLEIPVHSDGYGQPWAMPLSGEDCRRMLRESLFFSNERGH